MVLRTTLLLVFGLLATAAGCSAPHTAEEESPVISNGYPHAPCPAGSRPCVDIYFSTHEDDDLLFMNPDIENSIKTGNRVVVVFVTAGDVSPGPACSGGDEELYWTDRERGILDAYAQMTNPSYGWRGGVVTINGKRMARYDSEFTSVTLLFMRLRDFQLAGVWSSDAAATTRACSSSACPLGTTMEASTYSNRDDVVATMKSIVSSLVADVEQIEGPVAVSVSTQDATGLNMTSFGIPTDPPFVDYPDHVFSSFLVMSAAAEYQATTTDPVSMRFYRGYTVDQEVANLSAIEATEKKRIFAYYAQHDCETRFAGDPENNPRFVFGDYDSVWPHRNYAVRSLVGQAAVQGRLAITSASGQLGCVSVNGAMPVTTYSCASAPSWQITATNQVKLVGSSSCLTASSPSGTLTLTSCSPQTAANTMFLLTNGQLRANQATCVIGSSADNGSLMNGACDEKFTNSASPTPVAGQRCIDEVSGASASCTPANVALTATVRASSSVESAPWSKRDVNDGVATASASAYGYSSVGNSLDHTEWIELDFPTSQRVDRVVMVPRSDAGYEGQGFPSDFVIQVWNGSSWVTRVSKTQYMAPTDASPRAFRWGVSDLTNKIRITATSLRPVLGSYVLQLSEIEAYQFTGPSGLPQELADFTLILDPSRLVSTQLSDSTEMPTSASYYGTFRIGDRSICARRTDGVWCSPYTGTTLGSAARVTSEYSNANGWLPLYNGSTVAAVYQTATSSMIACGRGYYGAFCTTGNSSEFSNALGWAAASYYYGSVRYVDVTRDGRPDICGRGINGIECTINLGSSFSASSSWLATSFTDASSDPQHWKAASTGDTIQYGDVNGDGWVDVCGRGVWGMECALGTGRSFTRDHRWSFDADRRSDPVVAADGNFSIDAPDTSSYDPKVSWAASASYYGSIRLVDVNRDGFADVCGRGRLGIYCAFSVGNGFDRAKLIEPEDFTDGLGWSVPDKGSTITFGDLDGDTRIDVCGRGYFGVMCASGY